MEIYFDNSATTKVDTQVAQIAFNIMTENYGNPSSLHRKGFEAEQILKNSRKQVANQIGAKPEEIIFTSGGTEANNMAILGVADAMKKYGNKIITSIMEHSSVAYPINYLESQGYEIVRLSPKEDGCISLEEIIANVDDKTILVSIMLVNNEIGSINKLENIIGDIKRKNPDTLIHTDAVQGFGKMKIKVNRELDVDLLSASGHKLHGPKGVGMLYVKKGTKISPLFLGGGQQYGIRQGTEHMPLIGAFGLATEIAYNNLDENTKKVSQIKQYLVENILKNEDISINSTENSLPYILNISCIGIRSEIMLHFLEEKGIYVSSGSACKKGAASPTLKAIGLTGDKIDSAIRISLGKYNTLEDGEKLIEALIQGTKTIKRK